MHRLLVSAVACVAITVSAGSALAGTEHPVDSRPGVKANAIGGATAPNARLAAVIDPISGVVRSKGVVAVSHTQRGIYCITPASGINPNNSVPVVSVDYSGSSNNNVTVQVRTVAANCAAGRFEVITFADPNSTGAYFTSNLVGFTIVVP
jgi:hypothetical protein